MNKSIAEKFKKQNKAKATIPQIYLVLTAPSSDTKMHQRLGKPDKPCFILPLREISCLIGLLSVSSAIKYKTVVLSKDAYFSLEGRILAAVAFRRAMLIFSESSSTVSMSTCSSSSLYSHASWNSFCFVF